MIEKLINNGGAILIALFGGGALGAIIPALFTRKKTDAEAESTLSEAIMGFVKILQGEIGNLRTELTRTEGQLQDAQKRLILAEGKVHELGELVRRAEQEKQGDKHLIAALIEALKAFDPKNPLVMS